MQLPLLLDRSGAESLTDQIVSQLRRAIAQSQLAPGTQLPSTRRLAEQLEVARNTVIRAYDLLAVEGLAEARPASGFFVSATPVPSTQKNLRPTPGATGRAPRWSMPLPSMPLPGGRRAAVSRGRLAFDFAPGRTHPALFPLKLWRRLLLKQLAYGGTSFLANQGEAAGLPTLRTAIAQYLATTRGIVADPSQIVVTSGVQEGISLAARLFLHRGTTAVVEDPGAHGAARAFAATGSEVVGVPVDSAGLVVDELPQYPTALLHVTPSHQFPTGHVLSAERRDAAAAWARRCGCYLLEDDSDGEFRYEGSTLPAIAAAAPDCTIYLGTFSRTLGAGLRLGFMVVPPQLTEAIIDAKELLDAGNGWLDQAVLAAMMEGSSYASHVAWVRANYKESRDCLLNALRRNFGEVSVSGAGSGLHLLWHLPPGVPDATSVEALARRHRIGVYALVSGGAAVLTPSLLERRALLLGFGSLLPKQIDQGIDRLSEIIDDTIDNPSTDVTEFLVGVPEAQTNLLRPRSRPPAHLDSRFRHRPALSQRPRARASVTGESTGAAQPMALVSNIYHYPVKGLSAQALATAELEAGKPLQNDRVFALARPTAPIDRSDPKWAKKGLFAMLMLDEGLAQVSTHFDRETMRLTIMRGGHPAAAGCLTSETDRQALEAFFWKLLPKFSAAPVLVRSRGGHFMDKPDNVISLINLATVRALEERLAVAIDPLRFRANIYIDGVRPWEEFDWVGQEIRIGGIPLLVDRKNGRCGATNVDPATGRRDLDIPASLRATFGHKNLGVYLVARQNGTISVGDRLTLPGTIESVGPAAAEWVEPVYGRNRFICGGCYFIYSEDAGLPEQGIGPGTVFAAISPEWRCPDCGTEKTTFRPHPNAVPVKV